MTPLDIRPLEGAGAEVLGADLANVDAAEWNQLEAAFAAFGLLVFRDQLLSESEHVTFSRHWGSILTVRSEWRHPADPAIEIVPPTPTLGSWRAEASYLAEPPLGSLLFQPGRSADGEKSRFCSITAAFEALSSSTRRELEGLTAVHVSPDGHSARHPMVIVHPLSGRKTLFINPTYTVSIEGIDELSGLAILNQLAEHCQQPEFGLEVNWEPGTVVLVDHRSMWNFGPVGLNGNRSAMHRVGIAGTELTPAARTDPAEPSLVQRAGATLAGGVITAAMTGIAEVIEPQKARHEVEIVSEAPEDEPLTGLDFGDLPPLG